MDFFSIWRSGESLYRSSQLRWFKTLKGADLQAYLIRNFKATIDHVLFISWEALFFAEKARQLRMLHVATAVLAKYHVAERFLVCLNIKFTCWRAIYIISHNREIWSKFFQVQIIINVTGHRCVLCVLNCIMCFSPESTALQESTNLKLLLAEAWWIWKLKKSMGWER